MPYPAIPPMPLLALLLLPATLAVPQPNQRALESHTYKQRTLLTPIPEGVQVGQLEIGSSRFVYTYVNSTSIIGTVAIGLGVLLMVAVGLYLYDLYIGGGSRRADETVDGAGFEYYDPYSNTAASLYDPTTRIKR